MSLIGDHALDGSCHRQGVCFTDMLVLWPESVCYDIAITTYSELRFVFSSICSGSLLVCCESDPSSVHMFTYQRLKL